MSFKKKKNAPTQDRTVIALNLPRRKPWRWGRKIMRYNDLKMKPPLACFSPLDTHRAPSMSRPPTNVLSLAVLFYLESKQNCDDRLCSYPEYEFV